LQSFNDEDTWIDRHGDQGSAQRRLVVGATRPAR